MEMINFRDRSTQCQFHRLSRASLKQAPGHQTALGGKLEESVDCPGCGKHSKINPAHASTHCRLWCQWEHYRSTSRDFSWSGTDSQKERMNLSKSSSRALPFPCTRHKLRNEHQATVTLPLWSQDAAASPESADTGWAGRIYARCCRRQRERASTRPQLHPPVPRTRAPHRWSPAGGSRADTPPADARTAQRPPDIWKHGSHMSKSTALQKASWSEPRVPVQPPVEVNEVWVKRETGLDLLAGGQALVWAAAHSIYRKHNVLWTVKMLKRDLKSHTG